MSKKSKSGIEDALGIASASELNEALMMIRNSETIDDVEEENSQATELALTNEEIKDALAEAKHLKYQLRQIPDILEKEDEIDTIANDAAKYFEDIMDKAFNTEDRFAPELFNAANAMLKTALDGKNAIINAKLKLLDLELKKRKMEQDFESKGGPVSREINGQGVIVSDRNSLLRNHNK